MSDAAPTKIPPLTHCISYTTPRDIPDPLEDESDQLAFVERHDKRVPVPVDE
jgi:hypothetical protein